MRLIIPFFFILYFSIQCNAQGVIESLSRFVGPITFNLKSSPDDFSLGTGTLIAKVYRPGQVGIFLITNKHVLPTFEQSDSIHFRVKGPNNDSLGYNFSIQIFDRKGKYHPDVKFDPEGNDLAVIDMTQFFIRYKDLKNLTEGMFTDTFFLQRDSLNSRDVEIGDEVFFIGFPSFFYDKRNLTPIVRKAVIATSPKNDFYYSDEVRKAAKIKSKGIDLLPERLIGFLIDGNVFGGSSGSIVVSMPKYIMQDRATGKLQFKEGAEESVTFLGILSFSITNPVAQNKEYIQLGGVISADQIVKTIALFKK